MRIIWINIWMWCWLMLLWLMIILIWMPVHPMLSWQLKHWITHQTTKIIFRCQWKQTVTISPIHLFHRLNIREFKILNHFGIFYFDNFIIFNIHFEESKKSFHFNYFLNRAKIWLNTTKWLVPICDVLILTLFRPIFIWCIPRPSKDCV